ncbi:MAG TPA: AAA family ATPase [Candidatus Competibacteraceae bacterium]|nr:AAA family ATPase [Candidatus Competibacteraceae bacterium]HRZ04765.1 AAA family ATPase [Candidatus Competibacteraceae bacterium]
MRTSSTESNHPLFKGKEPRRFYHNALFDAACAEILDGLRERRGIILLTGEAGVGKTLLLRRCMMEADDIRFILLTNASLDFPDILNYLSASLELPAEHLDAGQQSRLLLDALAACARRNQIITLLIDDAHHLRIGVLRRLYDFVEMPAIPAQRLQVVLAGLPDIEGKLRQPELHRFQTSVTTRCRLGPLNDTETASFVRHQFETAQYWDGKSPSPAVIERIIQYCQGVPRAIVMLCDTMLLFAGLELGSELTPTLVDEAAKSCFLSEPLQPSVQVATLQNEAVAPAADQDHFNVDFPDLGLGFDFDLEETLKTDTNNVSESESAILPAIEPLTERVEEETPVTPTSAPVSDHAELRQPMPTPPLREFTHLLTDLGVKQDRKETQDQEGLQHFRNYYLRLLQGSDPVRMAECEQRMARLQETRQPMLVSLATVTMMPPGREGILCALLINPTWWLYREIRLRLHSPDLAFTHDGQASPIRLLDGRDAHPVYLHYRCLHNAPTTLWLELELCDHRGEWSVYGNRLEIHLDLTGSEPDRSPAVASAGPGADRFWPDSLSEPDAGTWLLEGGGTLSYTLPLELEEHPEQTHHLRTAHEQTLSRGTPLTRALLLAADPAQAPTRIELVSRPFMVFGRQSAVAGTGFGDFTLGLVSKYSRISRLHCVVCALGDQLVLMAASDQGHTYTGRNGQRLERGRWEALDTGDVLDVCDLYRLKLSLAWDRKGEREALGWDPQEPRDRFGRYLLDLVEVLRQRDQQADNNALRANLRNRYLHLLHMQDRVAELNGVGNPGALLYACFERDDHASQQIVHYYVPKWLPIGNSPEDGLRLNAPDVRPHHAELLFRDGMYWLQNLAASGSVRVGCHGLATNEVLALATGDTLAIGSVRFTFEGY